MIDRLEKLEGRVQLVEHAVIRIEEALKHKPTKVEVISSLTLLSLVLIGGFWAIVQFVGPSIMSGAVTNAVLEVRART